MEEVKRLVKYGASVNINYKRGALIIVLPVNGLPTSSNRNVNIVRQRFVNALLSSPPKQGQRETASAALRRMSTRKITPSKSNGKSPSPRSANKARASASKRQRPAIH